MPTRPTAALLALLALPHPGGALAADALPTLRTLVATSAVDGVVWFRPGELLLGEPARSGRPAVKVLEGGAPATLPLDSSGWEDLSGPCTAPPRPGRHDPLADRSRGGAAEEPPPLARGDLSGDGLVEHAVVRRPTPTAAPEVTVFRADEPVARGTLPMPAEACTGLIAEAADDRPALIVVWTSRGAEGTTVGVTVFEMPGTEP